MNEHRRARAPKDAWGPTTKDQGIEHLARVVHGVGPMATTIGSWLEAWPAWLHAHRVPAWELMQLVALAAAYAWFAARTRDAPRLRPCLLIGFLAALVGSIALGAALRIPTWIASGFRTAPFEGGFMAYGALVGLFV